MESIEFITFDLVSTPSFTNGRIYPKEVFIRQVEELKRQLNREKRKNKIIEIFGDDLFR
jgi:hypothetical protein